MFPTFFNFLEVVAQVVPIRREDYYHGDDDDEDENLVEGSDDDGIRGDADSEYSFERRNTLKNDYSQKHLRDRHSHLVVFLLKIISF